MFKVAVGMWNIDPQSFWKMTPREWWLIQDIKNMERGAIIRAKGGLTGSDKKELYEALIEAQNND